MDKQLSRSIFIESLVGNIKEKYFFEKKLGSGGYGAVYLAKNKQTGKFNGISIIKHQLSLLKNIESIRVVVGFMEEDVIDEVKSFRKDVIFVRNPNYQNTSNTYSISLAMEGIKEPSLLIDGDLLINKDSFNNFIKSFSYGNRQS